MHACTLTMILAKSFVMGKLEVVTTLIGISIRGNPTAGVVYYPFSDKLGTSNVCYSSAWKIYWRNSLGSSRIWDSWRSGRVAKHSWTGTALRIPYRWLSSPFFCIEASKGVSLVRRKREAGIGPKGGRPEKLKFSDSGIFLKSIKEPIRTLATSGSAGNMILKVGPDTIFHM